MQTATKQPLPQSTDCVMLLTVRPLSRLLWCKKKKENDLSVFHFITETYKRPGDKED